MKSKRGSKASKDVEAFVNKIRIEEQNSFRNSLPTIHPLLSQNTGLSSFKDPLSYFYCSPPVPLPSLLPWARAASGASPASYGSKELTSISNSQPREVVKLFCPRLQHLSMLWFLSNPFPKVAQLQPHLLPSFCSEKSASYRAACRVSPATLWWVR